MTCTESGVDMPKRCIDAASESAWHHANNLVEDFLRTVCSIKKLVITFGQHSLKII